MVTSLIEKVVRTGAMHTCATCDESIATGSVAIRRERRAMTYHERLHADGNMRVHWYHHVTCAKPSGETSTKEPR